MTSTYLGAEALTMTRSTADGFDDDEWRDLGPPLPPARAGHGQAGNDTEQVDDWPLRSYLKLSAVAGSVPCARRHAGGKVTWCEIAVTGPPVPCWRPCRPGHVGLADLESLLLPLEPGRDSVGRRGRLIAGRPSG